MRVKIITPQQFVEGGFLDSDDQLYNVIRFYKEEGVANKIVRRGLTLDEVTAHCNDPETSSATCESEVAKVHTIEYGDWFDGYTEADDE